MAVMLPFLYIIVLTLFMTNRPAWMLVTLFLSGKKGILVTLVHLLFIAVLYKWISVTFLGFLILGPALLVTWSARELFPRLRELLVRGGENEG